MASLQIDALKNVGTHEVGYINAEKDFKTYPEGAIASVAMDNYILGELFYEGGEAKVKDVSATAVAEDIFVVASQEVRLDGEPMSNFYNGIGERVSIAYLPVAFSFFTSAITGTPVIGQFAHFDRTTKKFILHDGTHANYATALKKFRVTEIELEDMYSIDGRELARLTVIK